MNVTIIGTGYVGLTSAAAFAHFGHHVTGVDIDADRIAALTDGVGVDGQCCDPSPLGFPFAGIVRMQARAPADPIGMPTRDGSCLHARLQVGPRAHHPRDPSGDCAFDDGCRILGHEEQMGVAVDPTGHGYSSSSIGSILA